MAGGKLDTPRAWLGVPQSILTAVSSCLLHPWQGTAGNEQEAVLASTQSSCSEHPERSNRAQQ